MWLGSSIVERGWLGSSIVERDLRLLVDSYNLNMSQQCMAATTKASHVPGCICRSITGRDRGTIIPLCSLLIKPHLEYCVQFWFPKFKKDAGKESIQRMATEMIKGKENLSYAERRKGLGLCTPEKAQRDIIAVFQYLKGSYKEDRGSLFTRSHTEKIRGNGYMLHTEMFYLNIRKIFYRKKNYSFE